MSLLSGQIHGRHRHTFSKRNVFEISVHACVSNILFNNNNAKINNCRSEISDTHERITSVSSVCEYYAGNGTSYRKIRKKETATYPWIIFITLTVSLFKDHQMHSDGVGSNNHLLSPIGRRECFLSLLSFCF